MDDDTDDDAAERAGAEAIARAIAPRTIETRRAIARTRRALLWSRLAVVGLLAAGVGSLVGGPAVAAWAEARAGDEASVAATALALLPLVVAGLWMWLAVRSARAAQLAADSPSMVASGRADLAEDRVARSLDAFCLFRPPRLAALHHLALVRHGQGRSAEAAELCRAVLKLRPGGRGGGGAVAVGTLLLLADSSLATGDLRAVHNAMGRLMGRPLSLHESLRLLGVQLDYGSRVGAWPTMAAGLRGKVEMAELMPAPQSAAAQALLAVAAGKTGLADWSSWLAARAGLLADPAMIARKHPATAGLWPANATAEAAP